MAHPVISTKLGRVVGQMVKSVGDLLVEEYLGLPYAAPPTGQLRFADPQPLLQLPTDPYVAKSYGDSCSQQLDTTFGSFEGSCMWNATNNLSEDCLYLNIWRPSCSKTTQLPVMVWIYGGGYYNGSSSLAVYDGKVLSTVGNVIVVNFNYRTGVLGFFSTGDDTIRGNYGLKDQLLALKWIKSNISSFGGDAENITVFGESAGSTSIAYHLMSPLCQQGLFHKAIFQSGSPKSRWAFMSSSEAKKRSKKFLDQIGYTENNNDDLLQFLRALDVNSIIENDWIDCGFLNFPWLPTVDGDYLYDEPKNLIGQGKFKPVDSIIGCNLNEGSFWCLYDLPDSFSIDDQQCLQSEESYQKNVDLINWDLPVEVRQSVGEFYLENQESSSKQSHVRDALEQMAGDRGFLWPTLELTRALSVKGAATYLYHLKHRASTEVWPDWMGVIHGADVQWIFGLPLLENSAYTDEEKEFSKTIMRYISNFAKNGSPNSCDSPCEWPVYEAESQQYLSLNSPPAVITAESKLRRQFCDLWETVAKQLSLNN